LRTRVQFSPGVGRDSTTGQEGRRWREKGTSVDASELFPVSPGV
jgi:hypothetical protein